MIYPRTCPVCGSLLEPGDMRIHADCGKKLIYAQGNVCMKCGKLLTKASEAYCAECAGAQKNFYEGRAVFFHERNISHAIYLYKYCGRQEYADFFAAEAVRCYTETVRRWQITAIVPVPLHSSRRKNRGYNQTELVARRLSGIWHIPLRENWLIRTRKTEAMKNLKRHGRILNLMGAFACPVRGKLGNVLLIDDIFTTGSTIQFCTQALLNAGAERVCFLTISIGKD